MRILPALICLGSALTTILLRFLGFHLFEQMDGLLLIGAQYWRPIAAIGPVLFNSGLSKYFVLNLLVQPVQLLPLTFKDSLHQGFRCWLWHCYRLGHQLTSSPSLDCLGYRFGCLYCFRLLLCAFLSWHNLKLKGSLRR
jgi:hypothetical protein